MRLAARVSASLVQSGLLSSLPTTGPLNPWPGMMVAQCPAQVLRLENVSKIYPTGEVLRDVTWEVKPGDRIGLVG